MDVRHNNNALKELNNCIGGLLHLGLNVITSRTLLHIGPNVITFRTLLHLGPNVITLRTLLHLGQLLHLGLQQGSPAAFFCPKWYQDNVGKITIVVVLQYRFLISYNAF